jgi:hypothetical protein
MKNQSTSDSGKTRSPLIGQVPLGSHVDHDLKLQRYISAPIKGCRDACSEDTASFEQEAYGSIDAERVVIANANPQ